MLTFFFTAIITFVWMNNTNCNYCYHFLVPPPPPWNGQMNSRYSIKLSLKTLLISTSLKEFLWSGNWVPMWLAYSWLQAEILSIFQAAPSALYCFWNGSLWGNHTPRMLVFSNLHFCRCRQKYTYWINIENAKSDGPMGEVKSSDYKNILRFYSKTKC